MPFGRVVTHCQKWALSATSDARNGNMMASRRGFGTLRRLPSTRWQATYVGPDLARHTAPHTFAAKVDAAWLAKEWALVNADDWVPRSGGQSSPSGWHHRRSASTPPVAHRPLPQAADPRGLRAPTAALPRAGVRRPPRLGPHACPGAPVVGRPVTGAPEGQ
jgi:hypothetical protein